MLHCPRVPKHVCELWCHRVFIYGEVAHWKAKGQGRHLLRTYFSCKMVDGFYALGYNPLPCSSCKHFVTNVSSFQVTAHSRIFRL